MCSLRNYCDQQQEADAKHQAKVLWHLCVVLMLLSKNNSTGVLIVQTVILLAVLAILIVVLFELC